MWNALSSMLYWHTITQNRHSVSSSKYALIKQGIANAKSEKWKGLGNPTAINGRSKESIEKQVATRKARGYTAANKGKPNSQVTRSRIGDALRGRPQSPEHARKRGLAIRGEKNGMYGRKPSNARKIIINNVEYASIADASKFTGISKYTIRKYHITDK